VTAEAIKADWARLFRVACALIRQVNTPDTIIDRWAFGGGTAMMLQIEHRDSRDLDIFLPDPQFLPFLDPSKHDFALDLQPADCQTDGARFLKIAFEGIGEIDFIVAGSLTSEPTTARTIEGEAVLLETVAEIIIKKVYHRGAVMKPRDIFDIAAAAETHGDSIARALRPYKDETATALATVNRLNADFVARAISQLAIRPRYASLVATAHDRAKEILASVR
jgi:hypothetical protein